MLRIGIVTPDEIVYVVREVLDHSQGSMHQCFDIDAKSVADCVAVVINKIKEDCDLIWYK